MAFVCSKHMKIGLSLSLLLSLSVSVMAAAPFHPLSDIGPMDVPFDLDGQPITDNTGPLSITSDLNLTDNHLTNAIIDPRSTAPQNPDAGQLWYDTTLDLFKYYNSTDWVTPSAGSGGGGSGSQDLASVLANGNSTGGITGIDMEGNNIDNAGSVTVQNSFQLPVGEDAY